MPGRTTERVARESYGRLLAALARRTGDLAGAEDALAEAFLAALERWPGDGIPAAPEGWLLAVAKRRQTDSVRRDRTTQRLAPAMWQAMQDLGSPREDFLDERVGVLLACAHPAIDRKIQTPLMLQAVLGIEAERIARAFLTKPTTMAQRLVRAKAKIRRAGIPLHAPEAVPSDRLEALLEAIYAAYTVDWRDGGELAEEALWLADVVVAALPCEPETLGLRSALRHSFSRKRARYDASGAFVPLEEQNVSFYDLELIEAADEDLRSASAQGRFGRFQALAAIESAQNVRRFGAEIDWVAVRDLSAALARFAPSIGAEVAHASALLRADGPEQALHHLDRLDPRDVATFQPYWSVRAFAMKASGQLDATTRDRAILLTEFEPERRWIERELS